MISLPDITQTSSNVLRQLKEATADLHREIESVVPLADPQLSWDDYIDYLQRVLPFYDAVETDLRRLPQLDAAVTDIDERWKKNLLESDLRGIDNLSAPIVCKPEIPVLRNLAQALGCL